ncbi:hypothetical protein ACO34A_29010 (plasmid) [Rhizobium sp. ACO-34A]|nr:IPT/TIG domain-containing protein [Rhizobium sp. ACO-34A]ATN37804.1 hypothetical protein ACO34A_29010 [Rhizobium sp. ACO-34A]
MRHNGFLTINMPRLQLGACIDSFLPADKAGRTLAPQGRSPRISLTDGMDLLALLLASVAAWRQFLLSVFFFAIASLGFTQATWAASAGCTAFNNHYATGTIIWLPVGTEYVEFPGFDPGDTVSWRISMPVDGYFGIGDLEGYYGPVSISSGSHTFSQSDAAAGLTLTLQGVGTGGQSVFIHSFSCSPDGGWPLLTLAPAPGTTLTAGTVNVAYSNNAISATGGSSAITYFASGLPTGLTMNATTGVISGTPTMAGDYTVTVTATSGTDSVSQTYPLHIGAQPVLSLVSASVMEGDSGRTSAVIGITLTEPAPAGGVNFRIATADDTAIAGDDYEPVSRTGAIGQGSRAVWFSVDVFGDTVVEPDETFFVNLTNITGATPGEAQATVTILNDDTTPPPTVSWSVSPGVADVTALADATPVASGRAVPPGAVVSFRVKPMSGYTYTGAATGCGIRYVSSDASGDLWQTEPVMADCTIVFPVELIWISPAPSSTHVTANQPYEVQFAAAPSGYAPFADWSWALTGLLPAGLSFDPARGLLSGTTTETGVFSFILSVTNGAGHSTRPEIYTLMVDPTPAPTITDITPDTGTTAGGTVVTITGANLAGTTSVTFDGTAATDVTVVNATTIRVTTPAHIAGRVSVGVLTPAGFATLVPGFEYIGLPTITSISPNSGTTMGGTVVTITGTNLANASAVRFGSAPAAITSNTATSITVTTAAHVPGFVGVAVTTPGGGRWRGDRKLYLCPSDLDIFAGSGRAAGRRGRHALQPDHHRLARQRVV